VDYSNTQQQTISKLIELGKTQGYLTHQQIIDMLLPEELLVEEKLDSILINIHECGIDVGLNEPVDINPKLITLKSFVEDYTIFSVRIKNAIAESSSYFDYGTLHDFINNNDNHALLRRTPNLGKGSIDELIEWVEHYIEYNNVIESSPEDKLATKEIESTKKLVDASIAESLSHNKETALKNISIAFFANNSKDLDVRTMNCLIEAEKNNTLERFFENLYDLYVAPSRIKNLLFNLPNFGKKSLVKLNIALSNLLEDEELLQTYEKLCNEAPESLGDYESISELMEREINQIDDKKELDTINFRHLKSKKLTLEEVGVLFDVTRERIRQIESSAAIKLKSSLHVKFSKEELIEWSRNELEDFFFKHSSFISLKAAKKILKNESEPNYLNLFIRITSKKLDSFLNTYFSYNNRFNGWFQNDEINQQYLELNQTLSFDDALSKSKWPIKISDIADACSLPDGVIIDQVFLSNKLELYEHAGNRYIKYIKLTSYAAIRFALRGHSKALTFNEIQIYLLETFELNISTRLISSALNYLPEAIMVGRDTFSRYTTIDSLNLSDEITTSLKKFVFDYLMERQEYLSAQIIFNEVNFRAERHEYDSILSAYVLFEICKLDDRFISRRGSMLGLSNESFKGVFKPLTIEIVDLMKKLNRPLTAGDITRELSSTRVLIDAAVSALLDANNSGFFEKRVVGYFLTDDQRHLEIDESKFEEYEFDDL
jgi:hypothetical protein